MRHNRGKSTYSQKWTREKHEEKNLENVLTKGRQTMRKINEHFRHLVSSLGKRRKTDNNKKKEERSREEDRPEGGNQTESREFQPISAAPKYFLLHGE